MGFSIDRKGYNAKEVDAFIADLRREYEGALKEQKARIFELKKSLSESEGLLKAHKEKSGLVQKAIYNAVAKAEEIEKLAQIKYDQEIKQLKAFHDKWTNYYNKIIEKYPLDDDLLAASKFNNQMKSILSKVGSNESVEGYEDNSLTQVLERNYESESARISSSKPKKKTTEKRIGYIKVNVADGGFDPAKKIADYFDSEEGQDTAEDSIFAKFEKEHAASKSVPKAKGAPKESDYNDRSESGFSFQEALNPKQDLSDIMKDLGLLSDES